MGTPSRWRNYEPLWRKGNAAKRGLDLTSYELVKALSKNETSEQALLAWMERSLRRG